MSNTQLPSEIGVLVYEVRGEGLMWPMLKIERRSDQHVHFVSGKKAAPLGLQILQEAVQLVLQQTTLIAAEQIAQGIARGTHSPALLPQTAASPGTSTGDVMPQGNNEAADTL